MEDIPPAPAIDRDTCYQIVHDELFPLCTDKGDRLGIEIEMCAVQVTSSPPAVVPFFNKQGKGLRSLLLELAQQEGWPDDYTGDEQLSPAALKLNLGNGDSLTFEPGGQIEYSSQPHTDLHQALANSKNLQATLCAYLARHAILLLRIGINPWHTLDDIGLQIAKPTYLLLHHHFTQFSPIGKRMMTQACTQQVNLDCGVNDELVVKRYLVANLIAPYVAAMFSTSGVWDGNHMQMQGFRTHIWHEIDNSRVGFPALQNVAWQRTRAACARAYLEFALQAFVVRYDNNRKLRLSFQNWIDEGSRGAKPTAEDFRRHLYTLFPEVRPRGYFELRSLDCQPAIWQPAPVAFYLGILYHTANLDRVLDTLLPELGHQEKLMLTAGYGLEQVAAKFHQRLQWLTELALAGMEELPARFRCAEAQQRLQVFFEHFTLQNKTPAADIQMLVKNNDKGYLCPEQLQQLEEQWAALLK